MKRNIYTLLLLVIFGLLPPALQAQNEKDLERNKNRTNVRVKKDLTETIVGTWQVDEIFKGKKDISNTDTIYNETLIFDNEGKYVTHGSEKIDSGLYRLNENHSILYLESETEKNTTEWDISFSKGGMTLKPRVAHAKAPGFKYTYTRATGN
jgi:hypothetical protein